MFLDKMFPRAILHVDGDAFFAACEVSLNPKLKGKPVVTGLERGIASAMTYEAKAKGVTRGMRLFEIRKICPDVIILPSDYETYSIFSHRMFNIVRRYTTVVEEYSIDECFADLTGLDSSSGLSYTEIAMAIKRDLEGELGMTFSVGVSTSKVLAKVASKLKKPSGLVIIPGKEIEAHLMKLPIEKVWGIGSQTSLFLWRQGIHTALEFASKTEEWVKEKFSKPHEEIWHELRGVSLYRVCPGKIDEHKSISKTRTFTPASNNREFIFSQLSKNIENACIKARRHHLVAGEISFFLKTQEFRYSTLELKLSLPANVPEQILKVVIANFDKIYLPSVLYRASGITLRKLTDARVIQTDLFGQSIEVQSFNKMYKEIDALSQKYGKHTLFLGSSMKAMLDAQHTGDRGRPTVRKQELFLGETQRKRLGIPFMGEVS